MVSPRASSLRSLTVVGLLLAGTVLGSVLVAVPARGSVPQATPATDAWAWGTDTWFNRTVSTPHGVHSVSAHLAWYTVFDRTDVSPIVTLLSVERWVLSDVTSRYCSPDCTVPTVEVALHHGTYQHALGRLNLTTDAVVYQNGSAVAAFGLLNSSAVADGWTHSSAGVSVVSDAGSRLVSEAFEAAGEARASLAFTPSLGLLPLHLAAATPWNATSGYVGSALWQVDWNYTKTGPSGQSFNLSGSPSGSLNATGNISLEGNVAGTSVMPDRQVLPAIELSIEGSFEGSLELLDGTILLPTLGEFFHDGQQDWQGYRMGLASMATHRLAVAFGGESTSFQLRAASAFFGTRDAAISMGENERGALGDGPRVFGGRDYSDGIPATEVTTQPVAPQTARTAGTCLPHGDCTTSGSGGRLPWGTLLVAAIVGAGAAGVALAAIQGRRRAP